MKKHDEYQQIRAFADGWVLLETNHGETYRCNQPDFTDSSTHEIIPDSEGFLPFYPHPDAVCPVDGDAECKYETDSPSWMASDNDECWEHGSRPFLYRPVQQKPSLAVYIAREIFRCGDEGKDKTSRIEFKSGSYADGAERSMGGLNLDALTRVIEQALDEQSD